MHVVAVPGGLGAGGRPVARAVRRGLEAPVARPDPVVPDDVHDAHPAGQRVGVPAGVGGEHLGDPAVGQGLLARHQHVHSPVQGAAVLVLRRPGRARAQQRDRAGARTGAHEVLQQEVGPGQHGSGAGALAVVPGVVLDGRGGRGRRGHGRERGQGEQAAEDAGDGAREGARGVHGRDFQPERGAAVPAEGTPDNRNRNSKEPMHPSAVADAFATAAPRRGAARLSGVRRRAPAARSPTPRWWAPRARSPGWPPARSPRPCRAGRCRCGPGRAGCRCA